MMKGSVIIILFAFILVSSCKTEPIKCSSLRVGVFKMYDGKVLENIIERDEETQLEFIPNTDSIESISKISWMDCSYKLKAYKYREIIDNPLIVKVVEVENDVFYVESKLENQFWLSRLFKKCKSSYKFLKISGKPSKRFYEAKALIERGVLPPNAKSWN